MGHAGGLCVVSGLASIAYANAMGRTRNTKLSRNGTVSPVLEPTLSLGAGLASARSDRIKIRHTTRITTVGTALAPVAWQQRSHGAGADAHHRDRHAEPSVR